jgi:hypothetical protein
VFSTFHALATEKLQQNSLKKEASAEKPASNAKGHAWNVHKKEDVFSHLLLECFDCSACFFFLFW